MQLPKLLFIALLFSVYCLTPGMVSAIETGTQAPGFKLQSVQEQEVGLADYKGRLIVLTLATTWCPTCKQLSAEIEKIGEFLKEKDAVVLEVFVQDSQAAILNFLGDRSFPMTFQALLDDGRVYKAYNVYLIPRFLLIDAEQIVRFDSAGRNVSADDIRDMVEEYSVSPALNGAS
jgi:peroxiredoxin